jgi:hypothetical protein
MALLVPPGSTFPGDEQPRSWFRGR